MIQIQESKQHIYELEVLNRCIIEHNTTLKGRKGELMEEASEWKRHVKKWKFHATHLKICMRKFSKFLKKVHVKKGKVEGPGINIQIHN